MSVFLHGPWSLVSGQIDGPIDVRSCYNVFGGTLNPTLLLVAVIKANIIMCVYMTCYVTCRVGRYTHSLSQSLSLTDASMLSLRVFDIVDIVA